MRKLTAAIFTTQNVFYKGENLTIPGSKTIVELFTNYKHIDENKNISMPLV